ncbi:MAG: hypothetical protein KGH73_10305, partial [Xanthomonadaceae bacterium]|nr:hypothetical protein [Xanthomonadaceae bacterium]
RPWCVAPARASLRGRSTPRRMRFTACARRGVSPLAVEVESTGGIDAPPRIRPWCVAPARASLRGRSTPRRMRFTACARRGVSPFAVEVESTGGIDARLVDELGQRAASVAIGELAEHAPGLVEREQHRRFAMRLSARWRRRLALTAA